MAGINTGKVLAGGLVAGIVMNVIDMTTGFLFLMNDMTATMDRLGLDSSSMNSFAGMAPWIVVDLLLGFIVVFAYAAMRPRFGVGPRTALIAGLTLYLTVTVVLYGFAAMGIFTMGLYVKSSAFSLISVLVASVAGAAVYRE